MAYGLFNCSVETSQIQCDQQDTSGNDAKIQAELFVFKDIAYLTHQQQIIAAEVDAEEQHEHRAYILNVWTVAGDAVILNSEAAGSGRAECGTDSIEQGHIPKQQEEDIHYSEQDIHNIEDLRGLAHPGNQLADIGAWTLSTEQVHGKASSSSAGRGDRKQKYQNAIPPSQ